MYVSMNNYILLQTGFMKRDILDEFSGIAAIQVLLG